MSLFYGHAFVLANKQAHGLLLKLNPNHWLPSQYITPNHYLFHKLFSLFFLVKPQTLCEYISGCRPFSHCGETIIS
ncbi:hypothetical protein ACET3Z_027886 [Daucus carota]